MSCSDTNGRNLTAYLYMKACLIWALGASIERAICHDSRDGGVRCDVIFNLHALTFLSNGRVDVKRCQNRSTEYEERFFGEEPPRADSAAWWSDDIDKSGGKPPSPEPERKLCGILAFGVQHSILQKAFGFEGLGIGIANGIP